jgi:hypothetical protein
VISPTLLGSSYYATALTYGGAGQGFGVNQTRAGLANTVGVNDTPGQIADLQSADKAMELDGVMAQTNYQVGLALQDRFGMMKRKELERKRAQLESGVIFG